MLHFNRALIPLVLVLAALALALAACADIEVSTSECADGGELWHEYRLFMGRGSGGAEVVGDEDWAAFLADTITPRFPDGLSVIDVEGRGPPPMEPSSGNAPRCCWYWFRHPTKQRSIE